MPKSLAEMRTSDKVGLIERTYPVCLAGKVVAEIELLEAELDLVEDRPASGRVGSKSPRRKLEQQIEVLRDEMNDHLAAIHFRAKPGHEWRTFVAAHPPVDGMVLDQRTGVSLDGVIKDMPEFIVDINGDALKPGDWEFVVENAADGDLKSCVVLLMDMHNLGVDIPKSRLSSRTNQELSID